MVKKTRFIILSLLLLISAGISAQVTTASMSGIVTDSNNEPLIGASVKATHEPTGTVYLTSTRVDGSYNLSNMRIGGPYIFVISYVGYITENVNDIQLALGEDRELNITLKEDSKALNEVIVTADRNAIISGNRTGAQEIITRERMDKLPTISRSLDDFTRLTPMSSGKNFAGTSYRFNNVTVDGASFNNSFGLSSALGSSGTEPISLEALEQVQVMIAPYDVRNGAFTGAAINSVTKSGTNQFHASIYNYIKNEVLTGYKVKDVMLAKSPFKNNQYGLSVAGPIVKNKLFFYLNGEIDRQETPINYLPRSNTSQVASGQYSIADETTLQQLSDFLQNKFSYNPGSYKVTAIPTKADRITARLDWNINNRNILSLKYFYLKSFNTNSPSTSGAPTNGRGPNSFSIPFSSAYYRNNNNFNIIMADLVSNISDNMSNTLKIGYSALRDFREMDGGFFPQVDIMKDGNAFTTFGTEANSYNNMLNSDIYQIQDNFMLILGKHQLTLGTQSDLRKFKNGYANSFAGQWRYASLDAFYNDVNNYFTWKNGGENPNTRPATTSITANFSQKFALQGEGFPFAYVDVLSLGFYAQDKWHLLPNLNITAGLRVDAPIFLTKLDKNPAAESITYQGGTKIDVSKYPSTHPLFSPRLGFNWDVMNNKRLQVRGGTGLFSGTPPYVWLSNQAGNNGLLFGNLAAGRPFDGKALYTPTEAEKKTMKMDMAVTDPNFKYPQLWKSNIAVDFEFGQGWIFTTEVLYNKDVNAIYHTNIGLNDPTVFINDGNGLKRPLFNKTTNPKNTSQYLTDAQFISPLIQNVVLMKNTNKGQSLYTTFQLQKTFKTGVLEGLYLNGSYTFGNSKGVTDGSSSVASSAWKYRAAVDPNAEELAYSAGSFDNKFLLQASYTINWYKEKDVATNIGFVYQIYQPFRYSYTYNGDLNGDGQNFNDLIYIPKDANDINIVLAKGDTRTIDEVRSQINMFIAQDPYLSKNRGEYAERNGAVAPFTHQLDANLSQDFKFYQSKGTTHTLRLSLDIFNLLNLLNKNWGVQQTTVLGNQQYQFLTVSQLPLTSNNYTPGFTMQLLDKNPITNTFKDYVGSASRWQIQIGAKYFF